MEKILREIIRETIRKMENTNKVNFVSPNFEEEWNEANRYPEFKKIGKEGWLKIAKQGKPVSFNSIKNTLSNVDLDFEKLEEPKKQRFKSSFEKNTIEMPIAVKFPNKKHDLVSGNTRLAGLVKKGIEPKIWVVDISNVSEMLNYPNWLRNTAQVPQNNPDGEHRYFLPKKKKIKEFAMGMMSPVEKAKHQRNMHRLMKILNKHQVQYFEYPNIPNTLVRKLYEAMDKIPGGLAQGKGLTDLVRKMDPKGYQYNMQLLNVLKKELELGIKTEMEHTSDPKIAKEIALDHLFEDPKYYTKLKKTGL
jgi:hypothetical protein